MKNSFLLFLGIFLIALFSPVLCFANSSWVWLTDTRPYYVLPYVIVATLLIEMLAVNFIPKVKKPIRVFIVILIANLFSFAAPYVWTLIDPDALYRFPEAIEHYPYYTICLTYFIITIAVELPFVFFSLKKYAEKWKVLLFTIFGANAVTTLFVAVVERTICYGKW